MIYNKHNFDDNSERIEDLENKLNDLVQCLAQGYYPTKLVGAVRVTRALEIKTIKSLKVSIEELIDVYNNVPQILTNNAVSVSVEATINSEAGIVLNKSERGNYWIIGTKIESQEYWLLPNGEINYQSLYRKLFNKYSINTVKTLFNFEDKEVSADKNLIIEQPAQVTFISSRNKWKLQQLGKIRFGINSRSYQLQALEQITQQHQELKVKTIQLQTEITQLKSFFKDSKIKSELLEEYLKPSSTVSTKNIANRDGNIEDDLPYQEVKSQLTQLRIEITQLKSSLKDSKIEPELLEEYLESSSTISTKNNTNRDKNIESDISYPEDTQHLEFVENPQTKEIPELDKWREVHLVHELTGHTGSIRTLAIANWQNNPQKQVIISGSSDRTIKIWNLITGKGIKTLDAKSQINAIAITPDGNSFISGGDDGNMQIWDIPTDKPRTVDAHSHRILAIAVSPDGKTIFSGSRDHLIKPWDYNTGKIRWNMSEGKIRYCLPGDYGTVIALNISSSGWFLASSTGDNIVRLWNLETHQLLPTSFQHSDLVWTVAISPDGKTLICGCRDKTIRLWDVTTGKEKHSLTNHSAEVWTVAISPDGQTLASGSGDNTIKFWNLHTGQLLYSLESHSNAVSALAFSPDGKFLVSASKDKIVKVWQASI